MTSLVGPVATGEVKTVVEAAEVVLRVEGGAGLKRVEGLDEDLSGDRVLEEGPAEAKWCLH